MLYLVRDGTVGCVVSVFNTRGEAEEALTKLQSTNVRTSSFHSEPSAHSPHTSSSRQAPQPDRASPPVSTCQPAPACQPAPVSALVDAPPPAPSSPNDDASSLHHSSTCNPASSTVPASSLGCGCPPAPDAGSHSTTFNGHKGEDSRHATPTPVNHPHDTSMPSSANLSMSFNISGEAAGVLIRSISERFLMSVL